MILNLSEVGFFLLFFLIPKDISRYAVISCSSVQRLHLSQCTVTDAESSGQFPVTDFTQCIYFYLNTHCKSLCKSSVNQLEQERSLPPRDHYFCLLLKSHKILSQKIDQPGSQNLILAPITWNHHPQWSLRWWSSKTATSSQPLLRPLLRTLRTSPNWETGLIGSNLSTLQI